VFPCRLCVGLLYGDWGLGSGIGGAVEFWGLRMLTGLPPNSLQKGRILIGWRGLGS
jgi:hypothetical protein